MNTPDEDTEELLRLSHSGCHSAAGRLLNRHRDRLRKMVCSRLDRRLRRRVDPSDVVQEVLLEAADRLSGYRREQDLPFYPWLRQLAWNRLLELHRQHVRVKKRSITREVSAPLPVSDESMEILANQFPSREPSPSAQFARNELQRRIRAALDAMSESDRELLIMRYVEQMKLREIAAVLEVGESAVKSRHIRALNRLSAIIHDEAS